MLFSSGGHEHCSRCSMSTAILGFQPNGSNFNTTILSYSLPATSLPWGMAHGFLPQFHELHPVSFECDGRLWSSPAELLLGMVTLCTSCCSTFLSNLELLLQLLLLRTCGGIWLHSCCCGFHRSSLHTHISLQLPVKR